MTIRNPDLNVTAAVGFLMADAEIADVPVFQLGGQARVLRHFAIIFDGILTDYDSELKAAGSIMLKFMTAKFMIDAGIVTGQDGASFIPMANFGYRF